MGGKYLPLISKEANGKSTNGEDPQINVRVGKPRRSSYEWLALLVVIAYGCSAIYDYQFGNLPEPLTAEQADERGFSEIEAMKHLEALTALGPHPVGSESLDSAVQYVLTVCQTIEKTAPLHVDVEVDFFQANSGVNRLESGAFTGKSLVYSDLKHVVIRISPQNVSEAKGQSVLVSAHIDSVFSAEGAGDDSSAVSVMLELARGISQSAQGWKNSVIFLFNTGEEEGLTGSHSFVTQHPWSETVRMAIDLEAMGLGGKSGIFQAGPDPLAIDSFAAVAKYPSGQIAAQDLFASGVINSATDFQVYKEVAGLSGLDFAYVDKTAVYHTKNDKLALLKKGSFQHLGENMLPFLLQVGASTQLRETNAIKKEGETSQDSAIYFDILGTYMVVYHQKFANMLNSSVIMLSLLVWATLLSMGGRPAAISLVLSCLSLLLMWVLALSFSCLVAFLLPLISSSPVPYVSSPWLVIGLFAAPAFLGALIGQHLGYLLLQKYLLSVHSMRKQLSPAIRGDIVGLEAERWLYKAGTLPWLILLTVGSYFEIGSSYLALVWLVSPAFANGLMETTLTPARLAKPLLKFVNGTPLKPATLLLGLATPLLISAGIFIRLTGTFIGNMVRLERNPGSNPEWLGSLVIAALIAALLSLTVPYLLAYIHTSGAIKATILGTLMVFSLSLAAVITGVVPPFTEDTSRAVNVVQVVHATGRYDKNISSYVSLFSGTPGTLTDVADQLDEGFVCGREKAVDFVTFQVTYGCWSYSGNENGWSESEIPTLQVESENTNGDQRITRVSIDTKGSVRWALAINREKIEDFTLEDTTNSKLLIPLDEKSNKDGRHIIQFAGGRDAPTLFGLTLHWTRTSSSQKSENSDYGVKGDRSPLLKLRTDVFETTPLTERILKKLPAWCSLFGKSTSPRTFAYIVDLPVEF